MSGLTDSIAFGSLFLQQGRHPYNWATWKITGRDVTTPWIDVAQIREQVNLYGDTSQDDYLIRLELAARFHIEDYLGRFIFGARGTAYYPIDVLQLPSPALDVPQVRNDSTANATGVMFYDSSQPPVLQSLDPASWFYDPTGQKVILYDQPTPVNQLMTNPIQVTFTIPVDPVATYPTVEQAALLLISHWYSNREEVTEKPMRSIPMGFDVLLRPWKDLVL